MLASPKDREITEAAPGEVFDFIAISAAGPALKGPELTKRLEAAISASDRWTFIITTAVVATAYLVGVYSDTYGSVLEYVTAFAAGAGAATTAASWKLLPWYSSYKPTTAPASSA